MWPKWVMMIVLHRILVLLLLRTSYVPDEYYQVIEPGHLSIQADSIYEPTRSTWEWEDSYRIRCYFLAFFSRLLYLGAFKLGIQHPRSLFLLGRLPFAAASILADILFLKWASITCPTVKTKMIWLVHAFSWYWNFASCRALTNTLESSGLVFVQYLLSTRWIRRKNSHQDNASIDHGILTTLTAIATSLVFMRPTSALFLIPIFVYSFLNEQWRMDEIVWALRVAWITAQSIVLLDSAIYDALTVTPWNFLVVNVFQSRAAAFGVQPWCWNFTQGLPVVLGFYFPLVIFGLWQLRKWPTGLTLPVIVSISYTISLSLVTRHQEHRFLLPCLPGLHLLVAWVLQQLIPGDRSSSWQRLFTWTMFVAQAAIAFYVLVFHQAGTEAAFSAIALDLYRQPSSKDTVPVAAKVVVAGPCYSFPGIAMISTPYHPVDLIKLPCKAPWEMTNMIKFDDGPLEATLLLLDEVATVTTNNTDTPIYFVTFDSYERLIKDPLQRHRYTLWENITHAHFRYDYDDPYPKYRVLIYTTKRRKIGEE